ncbi:family 16 glycosylhydrolase [Pseudoruegeria sp. HB172150]|uniref:family 16 glycosylhydrolase n=1 Tax=Pseudoruegeria sp. HB172150 TaxID=2721164 RepID=UPI001553E124|nr:family 16 glycosylhydrolase [Pseudoruegeria sp. HB172150]
MKQASKPLSIGAAAVVAVAIATSGSAQESASFFDDFNKFDWSLWNKSDGWSNGEWMSCQWQGGLVSISGGNLLLKVEKRPTSNGRDYACAEIQTRQEVGYGTYEVMMKTETGSGLNAALFTYIGPSHGQPHHEIDIEVLTRDTSGVSLNTYVDGAPTNGKRVPVSPPTDSAFAHFAFTWSAEEIIWYVNGAEVHRTAPGTPIPQAPQKLFASFWSSESFPNWMGPFEPFEGSKTMTVDWIAYTPEGEACRFPESILC